MFAAVSAVYELSVSGYRLFCLFERWLPRFQRKYRKISVYPVIVTKKFFIQLSSFILTLPRLITAIIQIFQHSAQLILTDKIFIQLSAVFLNYPYLDFSKYYEISALLLIIGTNGPQNFIDVFLAPIPPKKAFHEQSSRNASALYFIQRLFEVPPNIFPGFKPTERRSNRIGDPHGSSLIFRGNDRMGHRRWMFD